MAPPPPDAIATAPGAVDAPPATDGRASKAHIESLARGGLLKVVGGFLNGLFTFLVAIVLTRTLGKDGSGAFFVALALMTLLETAAGLGTDVGAVRAVSRVLAVGRVQDLRTTLRVAFLPVLVTTLVVGAAMFAFAQPFAEIFDSGKQTQAVARYVRALAVFLPLSVSLEMLMSVTRGFGTMKPDAYLDKILKAGLQLVLVLVVGVASLGVIGLAMAWGLPIVLSFVLAVLWTRKLLRRAERRIHEREDAPAARSTGEIASEFWRFSAPRALSSVFKVGIDRIAKSLGESVMMASPPETTAMAIEATQVLARFAATLSYVADYSKFQYTKPVHRVMARINLRTLGGTGFSTSLGSERTN